MQQSQPVLPHVRVRRIYQHLVEKQIYFRPQRGYAFERTPVLGAASLAPHALKLGEQIRFRTRFEQPRLDTPAAGKLRLPEDILYTLEARGQRLEILRRAHCLD